MRPVQRTWVSVVLLGALVAFSALRTAANQLESQRKFSIDGFEAVYSVVETPRDQWESDRVGEWAKQFGGKLKTTAALAYRKTVLPPGNHDMWIEKGKDEWYHLVIGAREDKDAPRLRTQFKFFSSEDGAESLSFALKLTGKGKKLKYSIQAGKYEGHANLHVLRPDDDEDDDGRR